MAGKSIIGALHVALSIDTAEFATGLAAAQKQLAGFGKLAAVGFAAAAAAAATAGVAVAAGIKSAIDAADELSKASQKVGVGVEALSALKYAGDLADVSLEQLSGGLKKLGVNMADAAVNADSKAAKAFRALGISVLDANGKLRSTDAVFADIAGAFAGLQDGAGKTALAVALFGKSGADLIPLLNSGKSGLAEMREEAAQLGIIISEQTGKAAEEFNDNLTRLKTAGTGLTTQLAAGLAPTLASVTGALVDLTKNATVMNGVAAVLSGTLKVLASVGVILGAGFAAAGGILKGVATAVMATIRGDFATALKALDTKVLDIGKTFATVKSIWTTTGSQIRATAPQVGSDIAAPLAEGAARAKQSRKDIETEAEKAAKAIREYVAAERKSAANENLSPEMIKFRERLSKASEALALGLNAEADALIEIATTASLSIDELQKVAAGQVDIIKTSADIKASTFPVWEAFRQRLEESSGAFYDTRAAADDLFYSIHRRDWVGAFAGLFDALKRIQEEFAKAGNASGKIGAVAGAAQAVGSAVGGKTGAALGGAASGALTGFQVGGPVGAVVGGILGGLGGLFGASKAKKRAKREAAERARLEKEQKAAELAAAKRELELRILGLTSGALAEETERRKDLLAAMDPSLRALQEEFWAREDAANAVAKRVALERELLRLTNEAAAVEADRADVLKDLTPEAAALQRSIFAVVDAMAAQEAANEAYLDAQAEAAGLVADARNDLEAAYDRDIAAVEELRDRLLDLAETLADFRKEIAGDLGARRAPGQQLARARAELGALAGKTDEASLAKIPELGKALADASRKFAATPAELARDLSLVARTAAAGEAAAREQVAAADGQIAAIEGLKTALGLNTDAALTTAQAEDALANAVINQSNVLQRFGAQLDAAAQQLNAALQQAAANANATPPATQIAQIDPASISDALTAATGPDIPDAQDGFALLAAKMDQVLTATIATGVNTGRMSRDLDDVIRGDLSLNTNAA